MSPHEPTPNLRGFLERIAALPRDGRGFAWEIDEALHSLDALIAEAREHLRAAQPTFKAVSDLSVLDWPERLTCDEAEALASLLRLVGGHDAAVALVEHHAAADYPEDQHFDPAIAGSPVEAEDPNQAGHSDARGRLGAALDDLKRPQPASEIPGTVTTTGR